MAKDLYHTFDSVKERYLQANDILEFDVARLSFAGPEEELSQTDKTQPAIFVHSYVMFELLKNKSYMPAMAAGHSLGEYSALATAGVFSFQQGVRLVKLRSQLMQHAGTRIKGAMAAIIGLDYQTVHNICQRASHRALVDLANFNSPDQIVISGTIEGVQMAMVMAEKEGARRTIQLNVSGAFHSPLMKPILDDFVEELERIEFGTPSVPIFSNVTGQPTNDPDEISMFLRKQLLSPVLWTETIKHMIQGGVDTFLEVGPGRILAGLLRKIDRQINAISVGTVEQLEKLAEKLY
ncbi:[acyl-carrier-protein] S-malonyltransferase [candidate division KSB1 bacterium]|nr:ACP S-malonyltransferase [candidate division KSB1 bacterium]RQW06927.1 MAG: [acyl-carrier-protein] S-malonyltransferase [candidate division KSB1 bacterium]